MEHVARLKDVREVGGAEVGVQEENGRGVWGVEGKKEGEEIGKIENSGVGFKLVCPVSQVEYTGFNKFYVSWACGCLVSENAIKELGSSQITKECLVCQRKLEETSFFKNGGDKLGIMKYGYMVQINPSDEKKTEIQSKLLQEKSKLKDKKKNK